MSREQDSHRLRKNICKGTSDKGLLSKIHKELLHAQEIFQWRLGTYVNIETTVNSRVGFGRRVHIFFLYW